MANQLTKIVNLVMISPGRPGDPGDPGEPPVPGKCTTTTYNRPIWGMVDRNPGLNGDQVLAVVGYETVTETTCTSGSPGRPARPPQDAVAPTFKELLNIGWEAGAISVEQLVADGALTFQISAGTIGAVVGLNERNVGTGYAEIDFAWYVHGGYAAVMEGGVEVSASYPVTGASVFRVQRRGDTVSYWIDSTLIYTSTSASYGTLFADASLYSGGDSVLNAAWEVVVGNAAGQADLLPPESTAADHEYAAGIAKLRQMTSTATGRELVGVGASFLPLDSFAGDKASASGTGPLHPLSSSANDVSIKSPSYAIGFGYMAPAVSWASGLTGESNYDTGAQDLPGMVGIGADHAYAEARTAMAPMRGAAAAFPPINNYAVVRGPSPTLHATATAQPLQGAVLSGPRPALAAATGHTGKIAGPRPTLTVSGTFVVSAKAQLQGPAPELWSTAALSGVSRADLRMPAPYALEAFTGGVVQGAGPAPSASIAATAGSMAAAILTLPLGHVDASASSGSVLSAQLIGPALQAVPSAVTLLRGPALRMSSQISQVVQAIYEAYAVNLKTTLKGKPNASTQVEAVGGGNEVTRYTDYPFTQIVRFGPHYYGVAADGLYLLEGGTDAGAPIRWAVQTTTTDFDSTGKKTPVSCYVGGRLGPAATFTVHTGEKLDNSYSYSTPRGATAQNYRQPFGRGLAARYYTFLIEGEDELAIDDLKFEINQLTRSI